jgi:hypothetical protein
MFLFHNHFYYYSSFLKKIPYNDSHFKIMIVDQIFYDSIISYMYISLPFFLMTYFEPIDLGALNISLGIHFSINALMLGLINSFLSRNWIKWCVAKTLFIGIDVIMHTITSNHFIYFVNYVASIISDLCCMHHTWVPPCIFLIINSCTF